MIEKKFLFQHVNSKLIKMNVSNQHEEILEFFVIKAPSPRFYNENK